MKRKAVLKKLLALTAAASVAMCAAGCGGTDGDGEKKDASRTEVSSYLGETEDKLVEDLGFEKNEFGVYPDLNEMVFVCDEGTVTSVHIFSGDEDHGAEYTVFGIGLGDEADGAEEKIADGFTLVDSYEIPYDAGNETRYIFQSGDGANAMIVDADADGKVKGVTYAPSEGMIEDTEGYGKDIDF